MKGGHQKRVEKVRRFASRNKVFSVLIVILVGFLLFRTVSNRTEKNRQITKRHRRHRSKAKNWSGDFTP